MFRVNGYSLAFNNNNNNNNNSNTNNSNNNNNLLLHQLQPEADVIQYM